MKKSIGFVLSSMLFASVCQAGLDGYQTTQIGTSALKTALLLYADTLNPADAKQAKRAVLLRLVARGLNGAAKGLDYKNGVRDGISLGTHLNASLWRAVKDLEEFKTLKNLDAEHDGNIPFSVLKKYYHGLKNPSAEDGEFDLDAGEEMQFEKFIKPILRLTEFGLSFGLTARSENSMGEISKKGSLLVCGMLLGQAVCEGLLRFVFKDRAFISPSLIGHLEAISSAAPCGYDVIDSVHNYFQEDPGMNDPGQPERQTGGRAGDDDDDDGDDGSCEVCANNGGDYLFPCCLHKSCHNCVARRGIRNINAKNDAGQDVVIQDCVECPRCRSYHKGREGEIAQVFKKEEGEQHFSEVRYDDYIAGQGQPCALCNGRVGTFVFPCCLHRACNSCVDRIPRKNINELDDIGNNREIRDCIECPNCQNCHKTGADDVARIFKPTNNNLYEEQHQDDFYGEGQECNICMAKVGDFQFPCCRAFYTCNGCLRGIGTIGINVGTVEEWNRGAHESIRDGCVQCPNCRECRLSLPGRRTRIFRQRVGNYQLYEEVDPE